MATAGKESPAARGPTIKRREGGAEGGVRAVGAPPRGGRAGPVTDPSRLRTPATSAADRRGASRPGAGDWRRRERTGIDPPEAPVWWCGRAPPRGDSRGRGPLVGGLRVERGGEGGRLCAGGF